MRCLRRLLKVSALTFRSLPGSRYSVMPAGLVEMCFLSSAISPMASASSAGRKLVACERGLYVLVAEAGVAFVERADLLVEAIGARERGEQAG